MRFSIQWGYLVLLLLLTRAGGQETLSTVTVRVDISHTQGSFRPIWNFFGYDEPNYTYAPNGKKLLGEIAALSSAPAYIRVHNLLTSGDGTSSLKWGSTNAYTEDASGNPIYNWQIVDRIFDTFHQTGVKPLVEIGFMPEALSTHPQPYRHNFPSGSIYTGWAYPPKDYQKLAELVFQLTTHLRKRYGDAEVKTWLWEVWNEPDIDYWQGTTDEYFKLYDYSSDAVRLAMPEAKIGGPDTTGPARPKAAEFLRQFLQHCDSGHNYATGKTGAPLDFISFHPKGSPTWQSDHVRMGIATQLNAIDQGFEIVSSFPKWRDTPVILGESDPEGCAACSAEKNPQNGYRNGPLYASYTAEAVDRTIELAAREHVNMMGIVTWAFEFEGQPYFAGYRELASNGLDKPVLNTFRIFGLLGSDRLEATSSGALDIDQVLREGVRQRPDVNVIATHSENAVEVLLWNYHDDDLAAPPALVNIQISGFPQKVEHAMLEHFRIDSAHSNAFTAWKNLGSPQPAAADQYNKLESAGQLQLLTSPAWVHIQNGIAQLQIELPRQGLSLVRIEW
jgi:xylan 1,4-beta-xylosidase